jgi:Uma2 family endonuclease
MQALEQDDDEDFYPSSDGRPIAEGDVHLDEMFYLINALEDRYRNVPDVYVTGNLLLYFRRGDRAARLAPDVFVVKGVPKRMRKSYLLWKEEQAPCFVIEVTSESTRDEDIGMKRDRYERFGVEEYFLHDPLGEYLNPPLQGYRLQDRRYRRIAFEPDGSLISWTTGLRLCREGERLRLVDLATGQPLPSYQELMEESRRLDEELRRLDEESRRLDEESRRLDKEIRAAEERLAQVRQGS